MTKIYVVRYSSCTPEGVDEEKFFLDKTKAHKYMKQQNKRFKLPHLNEFCYGSNYGEDRWYVSLWFDEIDVET